VLGELLRREGELAAGSIGWTAVLRIVVGVHDQLAFDGHRLVLGVVEVQPATEASGRRLARLTVHGIGPDCDQPRGSLKLATFDLVFLAGDGQLVRHVLQATKIRGLTAGQQSQRQRG
jgi:hypothetical protein